MAWGVQDLPGSAARVELLAAVYPCGRLSDRRQDVYPVAQARRRRGQRVSKEAVVSEHEAPAVNRAVGVSVLGPVEVGLGVHPQISPAAPDHLAGDPVVIDVRMRDDQPTEVVERAAAFS